MLFKFNVNLTEKDYIRFNEFWALKSRYGKKQIIQFRVMLTIITILFHFLFRTRNSSWEDPWIDIIAVAISIAFIQATCKPVFRWSIRMNVKTLKKRGKMAYSATSELEFFEDILVETTPTNRTEQKYSAIERISVVGDNVIYIHISTIGAYILPSSCFESSQQRQDLLEFLKTKCSTIDNY